MGYRSLSFMLVLAITAPHGSAQTPPAEDEQAKFFTKEVRPVLQFHGVRCHGDEGKPKGRLRMTTRAALLKGGKHGAAVDVDQPQKSLLLDAISYANKERKMPPAGKLPQNQIDILTKWVKMGS